MLLRLGFLPDSSANIQQINEITKQKRQKNVFFLMRRKKATGRDGHSGYRLKKYGFQDGANGQFPYARYVPSRLLLPDICRYGNADLPHLLL